MTSKPTTEWRQTTMREAVSFFASGDPFRKLEYAESGVAVLSKGDVKPFGRIEHSEKRYIREELISQRGYRLTESGDHLLTTRDLTQAADFLGLLSPVPNDQQYLVNQGANVVRFNNCIDGRFVVYWCNGPIYRAYIKGHHVGSTQIHLRKEDFFDAPLWLPELRDQRAIAHILGTLDDKIELNRRMKETLEAMARALFKSWFVDFDPVRAKAEGRDPGLPQPLADLFPDSFEDSELGEIPRGWSAGSLSKFADLMIGGDWGLDAPLGGEVSVRCLRGVDLDRIRRMGWSDAPVRFISPSSLDKRVPSMTDVLVEGSGECGRALACEWIDHLFLEPVVYSNFCKRLRCSSIGTAYFVEFAMNDLVLSGEMKNFVTGTAMPNLDHKGLLAGYGLVLPPATVLYAFASFASAARRRLYSGESRALAALRDALLPKLISGELRVEATERFVERVGR